MASCTTLDHIYPATQDGTPCYCGRRRWNADSSGYAGPTTPAKPAATRKLPRRGQMVRLTIDGLTTLWFVDETDREAGMFHIEGKGWHEVADIVT
jgi:hypothetical protein